MHPTFRVRRRTPVGAGRRALLAVAAATGCALGSGCAALSNPVAEGLPVRRLPSELVGSCREDEVTVPLACLRQPPATAYRLAPGDVLAVHLVTADNFLNGTPPPVHLTPPLQPRDQRSLPPALGVPIPVAPDGSINVPPVGDLAVAGLTVEEAREKIFQAITQKVKLFAPDATRLFVQLLHKRSHHVLVLRQEAQSFTLGTNDTMPASKRGTGHVVDLPAGENDVLHALAQTGGLPGLDACNAVVVFRGCFQGPAEASLLGQQLGGLPQNYESMCTAGIGAHATRLPLRLPKGAPLPFGPDDVTLRDGDVVFLESRDDEVFYTAGLLPSGEFLLPRDRDLDVLEAVARVRGPLLNGAFNANNLSGSLLQTGIGNPSPSLLVVLRRTPGGGQVPIQVDLNRALCDARERIPVRPGDILLLQEKPSEALARYFTQTFFNFSFAWQVIHERFATGVIDVSAPERIPSRIIVPNPNGQVIR